MYLNVVTFQIPSPSDDGGMIDVFDRLKALKELGVKVILHCFYYGGRHQNAELEALTEKVYYYKRRVGLRYQFSMLPYIVRSRCDTRLLENLLTNDYPILFEGIHCCYFLNHKALKNRKKWVRMPNVEQDYYAYLSKASEHFTDRLFYKIESCKLKHFEHVLEKAQLILAISEIDLAYFKRTYPKVNSLLMPACHTELAVLRRLLGCDC